MSTTYPRTTGRLLPLLGNYGEVVVGLSLLAALFYGAADFCGAIATKKTNAIVVTGISQAAGFLVLLALLPFIPGASYPQDYLWGALAGLCGAVGIALLYHALSIGKMGVVSPVTAVIAAAAPVVISSLRGDHLSPAQFLGIACALGAIVLVSLSFEDGVREISTRGLKEAILSGLALGGFYIFLAQTHRESGVHNLIGARVASVAFLVVLGAVRRVNFRPERGMLPAMIFTGVLDMSANVLYVFATFNGALAIAAVLTSLYPATTVFLAALIMRERLSPIQWLGVVLALAGVAFIALRL